MCTARGHRVNDISIASFGNALLERFDRVMTTAIVEVTLTVSVNGSSRAFVTDTS